MMKVDQIAQLMVEEALAREIPEDLVSRLYQVKMEVTAKIGEIMRIERERERRQRTHN